MTLKKLLKIDYCKYGKFFKFQNKFWELQISTEFQDGPYFDFTTSWTRKTDHAGFRLSIEILSFYFCIKVYDCRHWDDETDAWQVYVQR